jgi:endonuclease/exonuclease/phosphatase (EEP) superfamily protein YafD
VHLLWPALLGLVIAGLAAWAAARLTGAERGSPAVQLMAFTPYVAAAAPVPVAAALLCGLWWHAVVAVIVLVVLLGCVLPRGRLGGLTSAQAGARSADGVRLRVLTANLWNGRADATALVEQVRQQRIDLLAVQEHTADGERALDAAGLGAQLPYRISHPRPDAGGSALFSRFPLQGGGLRRLTTHTQAYARLELPGAVPVAVESAHPCAPTRPETCRRWASELAAQPAASDGGAVRVLLGDFNATLDHGPLRALIATGYRDAAAATGAGLIGTWPYAGRRFPPVTLDHVLADRRIAVCAVSVRSLLGSDHRAVYAELVVPSTGSTAAEASADVASATGLR